MTPAPTDPAKVKRVFERLAKTMVNITGDRPPRLDERFDAYLMSTGDWEEIDLADVIWRIERGFGFRCPGDEWESFFGFKCSTLEEWEHTVGPFLTFSRLVQIIAKHLEAVEIRPRRIVGPLCVTAGAYRAIEQITMELEPEICRFGPSTPILTRLRGSSLAKLWARLRWLADDALPPLLTTGLSCARSGLYVATLLGIVGTLWMCLGTPGKENTAAWLQMSFILAVQALTAWTVGRMTLRYDNQIPGRPRTFGDLARIVAAAQPVGLTAS